MRLEWMDGEFCVCRWGKERAFTQGGEFWFWARTDVECSLLCPAESAPEDAEQREDGWKGFRIAGQLDFSLIGILAGIAGILAEAGISIFAVSTFDTDYIFLKRENAEGAENILRKNGYQFA